MLEMKFLSKLLPIDVVAMQAQLIDLPLITIELRKCSQVMRSIKVRLFLRALKECGLSIDGVAFGDMFCNDITPTTEEAILNLPAGNVCSLSWEKQ